MEAPVRCLHLFIFLVALPTLALGGVSFTSPYGSSTSAPAPADACGTGVDDRISGLVLEYSAGDVAVTAYFYASSSGSYTTDNGVCVRVALQDSTGWHVLRAECLSPGSFTVGGSTEFPTSYSVADFEEGTHVVRASIIDRTSTVDVWEDISLSACATGSSGTASGTSRHRDNRDLTYTATGCSATADCPSTPCADGLCAAGECSFTHKADGTVCGSTGSCSSGVCVGASHCAAPAALYATSEQQAFAHPRSGSTYGFDEECLWTIAVAEGERLQLVIEGGVASGDSLVVIEGSESHVVLDASTSTFSGEFSSSVSLRWNSDDVLLGNGFTVTYVAVSSDGSLDFFPGIRQSVEYPDATTRPCPSGSGDSISSVLLRPVSEIAFDVLVTYVPVSGGYTSSNGVCLSVVIKSGALYTPIEKTCLTPSELIFGSENSYTVTNVMPAGGSNQFLQVALIDRASTSDNILDLSEASPCASGAFGTASSSARNFDFIQVPFSLGNSASAGTSSTASSASEDTSVTTGEEDVDAVRESIEEEDSLGSTMMVAAGAGMGGILCCALLVMVLICVVARRTSTPGGSVGSYDNSATEMRGYGGNTAFKAQPAVMVVAAAPAPGGQATCCGMPVEDGHKFCRVCGSPVEPAAAGGDGQPEDAPSSSGPDGVAVAAPAGTAAVAVSTDATTVEGGASAFAPATSSALYSSQPPAAATTSPYAYQPSPASSSLYAYQPQSSVAYQPQSSVAYQPQGSAATAYRPAL